MPIPGDEACTMNQGEGETDRQTEGLTNKHKQRHTGKADGFKQIKKERY